MGMRGQRIPTTLVMYWMAEGLQYAKMGVVHIEKHMKV